MVQYVSLTFSVCSEMTTTKHLQCLYTLAHSSPKLHHTVELGCIVLAAEFRRAPCAPHPLISCQAASQCLPLKLQKSDGTRAEAILLLISHSSSFCLSFWTGHWHSTGFHFWRFCKNSISKGSFVTRLRHFGSVVFCVPVHLRELQTIISTKISCKIIWRFQLECWWYDGLFFKNTVI